MTLGRAVTSDLSPPVIGLVNIVHLARTPGGQKLGDLGSPRRSHLALRHLALCHLALRHRKPSIVHGGDVLSGFFFLPFSMPWLITRGDPWRSVTLGRAVTVSPSP